MKGARYKTQEERIRRNIRIDFVTGCWIWQLSLSACGYGRTRRPPSSGRGRSTVDAHLLAYEIFVGAVPAGLELDHLCRNRACANPAHLEPVTHRTNMLRTPSANVEECPKRHPYDEANTYWHRGRRFCRACNREAARRYKATRRGLAA